MRDLTEATFEEVTAGGGNPVLVDFWAEWCGPCKELAPVLEELDAETPGVEIAKVNIEKNMEIAGKLGIRSVPMLILFKDGEEVARTTGGGKNKGDLHTFIQQHV